MKEERYKKFFLISALIFSVTLGFLSATRSMAQLSAPPLPDTTNIDQIGTDALSKLLNAVGSFQGIRSSLQTIEDKVGQGTGILNSIQKTWVDINTWVQDRIGISLRSVIQFIGYVFIFVAVIWIKVIRWFLGII
jgi:hypothetical protein